MVLKNLKVLLHHAQSRAKQRVICSREDALAFTPQAILRVVAKAQHATTHRWVVRKRVSLVEYFPISPTRSAKWLWDPFAGDTRRPHAMV